MAHTKAFLQYPHQALDKKEGYIFQFQNNQWRSYLEPQNKKKKNWLIGSWSGGDCEGGK